MKRGLMWLALILVLAVWVGVLVARDPGYVLVSYDGSTLQTSLWVMLILLVLIVVGGYWLLRLTSLVRGSAGKLGHWRESRKQARAQDHTSRGLLYLQEGDLSRAEKFLRSAADLQPERAVNHINLARIADQQGDAETREACLRRALENDPGSEQAVRVAAAELAVAREDWQQALVLLDACKENRRVRTLKRDVLAKLQDWDGLAGLLPRLAQDMDPNARLALEKVVVMNRLARRDLPDDDRALVYKRASDVVREDTQVTRVFCETASDEKEKESVLRKRLKKSWDPELVELYGSLGAATAAKRLKTARGWQKAHPDDPALLFCLGELYELEGDREQARACFERSLEAGPNPMASRALANLLAFEGDFERSNEHLRKALERV